MNRKVFLDIAERTLAAYVTTFLGIIIADGFDLTSISALKAAAVAALPAALSVIKGAIGSRFGDKDSAAWLPERDKAGGGTAAGTGTPAGGR